jgi:ferritin
LAHDRIALPGFSKFFEHHREEKLENAQKLINYGIKRGSDKIDIPHLPVSKTI